MHAGAERSWNGSGRRMANGGHRARGRTPAPQGPSNFFSWVGHDAIVPHAYIFNGSASLYGLTIPTNVC